MNKLLMSLFILTFSIGALASISKKEIAEASQTILKSESEILDSAEAKELEKNHAKLIKNLKKTGYICGTEVSEFKDDIENFVATRNVLYEILEWMRLGADMQDEFQFIFKDYSESRDIATRSYREAIECIKDKDQTRRGWFSK